MAFDQAGQQQGAIALLHRRAGRHRQTGADGGDALAVHEDVDRRGAQRADVAQKQGRGGGFGHGGSWGEERGPIMAHATRPRVPLRQSLPY